MHQLRKLARDLDDIRGHVASLRNVLGLAAKRGDLVRVRSVSQQLRAALLGEAAVSREFDEVSAGLKLGRTTSADGAALTIRMADCHPDRKHVAKGLCRSCNQAAYWKRRIAREIEAALTKKVTP
jgi:hypothetical protein